MTIEDDENQSVNEDHCDVWKENWQSVMIFLACETQWRCVSGLAGLIWIGMDYSALDIVMRRRGAADHIFDDVQLMEQEALKVFGEVAE